MTRDGRTVGALRGAFATVDPSRAAGDGCPAAFEIWDAVHGSVGPERVRVLAEHLAACPSCAEDWRLARNDRDKEASKPVVPLRKPRWSVGLAAAALLAFLQPSGPEAPVYRDPGTGRIESMVPEDDPLPRNGVVLSWTQVGDGAVYAVKVGTMDLSTIASTEELREPEFRVPESALVDLPPGISLVWKVEARFPDGGRIASGAFLVRIE